MTEPRARKLEGAIAGRALYDGRLDAAEALKLIAGRAEPPECSRSASFPAST